MQLEIKFKSIAMRWFLNVFVVVAAIVCAVAVAFSALFFSIYIERMEDLANDYSHEFSSLSGINKISFKDSAITLAGEFKYKNKIEVQVLDNNGEIIVSTTGFASHNTEMPDYNKAKETGDYAAVRSETAEGENIMAGTTMLYDSNGKPMGAYRWVTSMNSMGKMMTSLILIMSLASILVIGFCTMSGVFFIKSI